jgi:polysaccharide pyruvyl transferase WcaK-like protein
MACVGASVWHLNNPLSRLIIKWVFKHCHFLSLREESSYKEVKALLGKNCTLQIAHLPDLSFAAFNYEEYSKVKRPPFSDSKYPKIIGLTIVDWMDDGKATRNNYIKVISGLIKHYINQGSKIVIIPQVTKKWEGKDSFESEIMQIQGAKENISILRGNPSINSLFSIYSKLDFLIATRMHSAIFASFVGTPLVVIPYDKGAKWNIIRELGYKDQIINYSDMDLSSLLEMIQNCWSNKENILKIVSDNCHRFSSTVNQNIIRLLDISPFRN